VSHATRARSSRKKAERQEVTIEKIVASGVGLARTAEGAVLVPRAAPGERVAIEIEPGRTPRRGRLLAILSPAPERIEPPCAALDRCGGCALMFLADDAQRRARASIVREALPKALRDAPITHHAATPPRGRTRARWHAKGLANERLVLGYLAGGSHVIVPVERCVALDPRLEDALEDARAILQGAAGEGEICAALGHGGLPVLAIEWPTMLPPHAFAESERRVASGRLAGVAIAVAGAKAPASIGDPRAVSTASDGAPLLSPPFGFAQASEIGDAALVRLVVARAGASGKKVLELFSGSGNFTVALAREASRVHAVEVVAPAVRSARANLEARGLANVKLIEADADAIEPPSGFDVVVLDPPRAGARGACGAIAKKPPKRVVYVSCDPATLGRDLATLLASGLRLDALDAVDLFPGTSHVECVATLVRD
jgi:23S rRNA (uracil1939-C5)-methyltransferase